VGLVGSELGWDEGRLLGRELGCVDGCPVGFVGWDVGCEDGRPLGNDDG
jgi:hypothetical protein